MRLFCSPRGRYRLLVALLALPAAAVGCGYDDPGEGTQSVRLEGALDCGYPDLVSRVRLVLARDTEPLVGATVTLIDPDSHESLEVAGAVDQAGVYAAEWPGYHRRVQIHVWQGKDGMTFQIEGPSQHVIDSPRPGTLVGRNDRLKVRWRSPDGVRADDVLVQVNGEKAAMRTGRDGGKARFASREYGRGQQVLTVRRSRHLQPHGGAAGSRMTSSYAVSTPFVRLHEDGHP